VVVHKIAETNIGTEDTGNYSDEMKRKMFESFVIIEMDIKMSFQKFQVAGRETAYRIGTEKNSPFAL